MGGLPHTRVVSAGAFGGSHPQQLERNIMKVLKFISTYIVAFVAAMSIWNAAHGMDLDPRLPKAGGVVTVQLVCLSPDFLVDIFDEPDEESTVMRLEEHVGRGNCGIGYAETKILSYVTSLKDYQGDTIWIADIEFGDRTGYTFTFLPRGRDA